jgi:hypothetical protein
MIGPSCMTASDALIQRGPTLGDVGGRSVAAMPTSEDASAPFVSRSVSSSDVTMSPRLCASAADPSAFLHYDISYRILARGF